MSEHEEVKIKKRNLELKDENSSEIYSEIENDYGGNDILLEDLIDFESHQHNYKQDNKYRNKDTSINISK